MRPDQFHALCEDIARTEIERIRIKARNWPGAHTPHKRQTSVKPAATRHANCRSVPQLSMPVVEKLLFGRFDVHDGGPCPVPADTPLWVLMRGGYTYRVTSSHVDWKHTGASSDIVGWKPRTEM